MQRKHDSDWSDLLSDLKISEHGLSATDFIYIAMGPWCHALDLKLSVVLLWPMSIGHCPTTEHFIMPRD